MFSTSFRYLVFSQFASSTNMQESLNLYSKVWSASLTDNGHVKILNKLYVCSDGSIFSDNKTGDIALADVTINNEVIKVKKFAELLCGETMDNYSGNKELFSVHSSPIHEAKNIRTSLNDHSNSQTNYRTKY